MDKRILLGLALAFTVDYASATTFMLSCEGCSSEDAKARLTQHAIERQIELPNPVYVANAVGNQLFSYAPTCHRRADQVPMRPGAPDPRQKGDPAIRTANSPLCVEYRFDDVAPEPMYAQFFAELRQLHVDSGGSMQKTMEIDAGWIGGGIPWGQMNGLDVIADAALRVGIGDAMRDHCFLCRADLARYTMFGVSFIAPPANPIVEFRITFRDGVSFLMRWQYPYSQLEYVRGSARTPGGQALPDGPPEPGTSLTYFFGPGTPDSAFLGTEVIEYLRRWFFIGDVYIGGGGLRVGCTYHQNQVQMCTVVKI